ncbi:HAD-IIIA family hydrolase [Collinsella ihumii]|uniref:D,D-heptose 1,7-bisphosphate phosphatase n=1 Tax=Collinsella ihumii TaxID=1720204 RepID=A0AAW7JQG5_9ACTN|nr:HAD-IIIA family hydrolase [Collinsella ihumii]MDN0069793.1 HAD-IIIA family hydrolase [Collinsella ihumii]
MSRGAYRGTAGRVREAVVLAGGFGTRLAHVVPDVCKPMAPVAGEPFLRRVLDQLDAAGFARVVIADGYRREQIESYFMGTYRGLEVDYSPEDSPLLTGGAVRRALRTCTRPEVFVLNGDTWLDVDFDEMEASLAARSGARCCIAAKRMESFDRYGTLDVGPGGRIRAFREKAPCDEGLINGGTYLVRRDALEAGPDVFSLEGDWFARVVADGALLACETGGGFIDIGVPEDYERAQSMFAGAGNSQRLAMFDRDGTVNVDTVHMHRIEDCELIESTVDTMRSYSEDPAWRVAVVTNQAGIAKGLYSVGDMRLLHRQMAEVLRGRGVEVDAWYFCPHHPDFTGECGCRKPAPGMLLRAMRDFRAVPARCVMHGDKESDRLAAETAGVRFVWAGGRHGE